MSTTVICDDGFIQYESVEIVKKFSNFLCDILSDTCCKAVILLPEYSIGEWNDTYVKSIQHVRDSLVNPVTGIVEVSAIM